MCTLKRLTVYRTYGGPVVPRLLLANASQLQFLRFHHWSCFPNTVDLRRRLYRNQPSFLCKLKCVRVLNPLVHGVRNSFFMQPVCRLNDVNRILHGHAELLFGVKISNACEHHCCCLCMQYVVIAENEGIVDIRSQLVRVALQSIQRFLIFQCAESPHVCGSCVDGSLICQDRAALFLQCVVNLVCFAMIDEPEVRPDDSGLADLFGFLR